MPIETVDVDDLVTDKVFDDFLGGQVFTSDMRLAPEEWENGAKPARQYALDRTLETLRRRTPPIDYSDLAYPSELRLAILYGAAEHLYQLAMSTGQGTDIYEKQRQLWSEKFDAEVTNLAPTLVSGVLGTSGIAVARR